MKATSKNSQDKILKWQNFEILLNYEENNRLQLYLRNTKSQKKFKITLQALPDSLKCCNYGSLQELYCDLSVILSSRDKSDLSRFKIEENGTIKISKKSLNGRGKVGQLQTYEYFQEETCKGTSDQQKSSFNFNRGQSTSKIKQISQQMSKQKEKIFKLQNQNEKLKKTVQNLITENNNILFSLSSNKYTRRRRQFMKQSLVQKKKMEKIFIKNFICDFYQRKHRLEIFFVNIQNTDEFVIEIQNSDLVQKMSKNIEYYIKKNTIQQKVTISGSGILKIKSLQQIAGELVECEKCFDGSKIICNSFQNIQKTMWLQKQKNQQNNKIWKAQVMAQFQKRTLSMEKMLIAQISFKISKILTRSEQCKTLIHFFNTKVYKFQLLFRESQFKNSAASFHQKCDNIPNTLVLVKTDSGRIIGGYTPIKWDKSVNNYINDQSLKSFLFSLTYGEKLTLSSSNKAIYSSSSCGPSFGEGCDLSIQYKQNQYKNSYAYIGSSYKHPNYTYNNSQSWARFTGNSLNSTFKTQEYEVYQVIFQTE